jgi:hypothetical protein
VKNREKISLIEPYVNSIIANENKSLTITGFYLAYLGVTLQIKIEDLNLSSTVCYGILNFLIFLFVFYTNIAYRKWKTHYLECIQNIFSNLKLEDNEIPSSFQKNKNKQTKVFHYSVDKFSIIFIAIFGIVSNVLFLISINILDFLCPIYYF